MLKRLICIFVLVLNPQAFAGELLIETALTDDGALLVTYTPPVGVTELRRNRIDDVSNDFWTRHVHPPLHCRVALS